MPERSDFWDQVWRAYFERDIFAMGVSFAPASSGFATCELN